jgi:hypothetical protein
MLVLGACWAHNHFGEKERHGGKTIINKACEACMQEEGKDRNLAEKAIDENVHAEEKSAQGKHERRLK